MDKRAEKKQIIVAIGRESGSGGYHIGKMLAEELGIAFYDAELLEQVAAKNNMDLDYVKKHDESPVNKLFSRRVNGFSNSPAENVALMQFQYIRELADRGDSFVVVGRCAEEILHDKECLVSVFITGDKEDKIRRTMEYYGVSEGQAEFLMNQTNRKRKEYHNHFCSRKWGDSRGYDLCINSSKLGVKKTVDFLKKYLALCK